MIILSSFAQFRPVSVGNVISKVISKIINNRLICFLPKLINEEQAGFVKGRDIFYHIQLAQEVITDLDKKCRGGNLVLKLDMLKAYDRLEWSFLFAVLRKFGFSYRFIEIIKWTLNNNWFTLLVNGQQSGFFKSSRGLKQGDPLSLSLFILAQEVFSRGLKKLFVDGRCLHFATSGKGLVPSHLFFADDALIFCRASSYTVSFLMVFITDY